MSTPKAFISYTWSNDAGPENTTNKEWVKVLATRLRGDGVDITIDQWELVPGDQLPHFMEKSI